MELTRFADETRRLQSELKPTPPWSWVAAQMAGALAGFESGGLTDALRWIYVRGDDTGKLQCDGWVCAHA